MATVKDLARMKICFCLIFFRVTVFAWCEDPDEVNWLQGKITGLQVSLPDWSHIIHAANDAVDQGIGKARWIGGVVMIRDDSSAGLLLFVL